MKPELSIEPLTDHLVQMAYPLAQGLDLVDVETWRTFVDRHRNDPAGDAGGLVARSVQGYLCGLLLYRIDRRNKNGATLVCEHVVAADLPGRQKPMDALIDAAERIARRSACRWICVALPADGDPFATEATGCQASLFRAGYALEALSFRRRAVSAPGDSADSASAAANTDHAA